MGDKNTMHLEGVYTFDKNAKHKIICQTCKKEAIVSLKYRRLCKNCRYYEADLDNDWDTWGTGNPEPNKVYKLRKQGTT